MKEPIVQMEYLLQTKNTPILIINLIKNQMGNIIYEQNSLLKNILYNY